MNLNFRYLAVDVFLRVALRHLKPNSRQSNQNSTVQKHGGSFEYDRKDMPNMLFFPAIIRPLSGHFPGYPNFKFHDRRMQIFDVFLFFF